MKNIQTQARIPADLHQWMKDRAARNNRSMNGELIDILEKMKEAEKQESQKAA